MKPMRTYQRLFEALGYAFEDDSLLTNALTHRSAAKKHNERLEFLGDAVLGMVVGEYLYTSFPDIPEGKLTRMRATLVKGDTLAAVAQDIGLGDYIQLGSGEKKSGGHRRASILADAFEATLGAIYLEAGLDTVSSVIKRLLKSRMDKLDPHAHPKDNKTQLQEWLQARKLPLPKYEVLSIQGKDHAQTFVVSCSVDAHESMTQGKASSRRYAEQEAAKAMLEVLHNA